MCVSQFLVSAAAHSRKGRNSPIVCKYLRMKQFGSYAKILKCFFFNISGMLSPKNGEFLSILSASPLRPFCQPHGPRKKENPPQSLLKKGMKE